MLPARQRRSASVPQPRQLRRMGPTHKARTAHQQAMPARGQSSCPPSDTRAQASIQHHPPLAFRSSLSQTTTRTTCTRGTTLLTRLMPVDSPPICTAISVCHRKQSLETRVSTNPVNS